MAFVAPFITAAIGLTGAAAVIGEAAIGIGLSLGVSYLARKLQPKSATSASQGMQLSVAYDANGPRQFAFGRVASAGTLVYHNVYGPNGNDYLQLVFKLADLPSGGLQGLYVDGSAVTVGSTVSLSEVSGSTVSQYPGLLWVNFKSGAWSQTADSDLVAKATGGAWSANNRGRGVCYLRVTAKYDPEKFKNGRPSFLPVFDGALLYDWRKDSTAGGSGAHRWGTESTYEWTDNPAVVLYNYMRGLYVNGGKVGGMSVPAASLPVADWTAAANACDELVTKKAGGTEKRYRANGIINLDTEHATVIRDLLASMAGTLVDANGVFKLYAGVAQSPVMTLTDDDLMSGEPVSFEPKLSRSRLVNAVFGSFTDPAQMYQDAALPPRISPSDKATDGDTELTESYGLGFVLSSTQGQRILEIFRRAGRHQRGFALKARAAFSMLEAGDWITFNSTRYGLSGVVFEVLQARPEADESTSLSLRERSVSIYGWNPAIDELDPLDPQPVGAGGARFESVGGLELSNVTLEGGSGARRPGLHIVWDPVTDPTVVDLHLEYRKVGDTVALKRTIVDPATGSYTWMDGVQGSAQYEARLIPVTLPKRPVVWSGWVAVPAASATQIVAVANYAHTVDPEGLPPAVLNEQEKFELSLAFEKAEVLGSVSEQMQVLHARIESVAEHASQTMIDAWDVGAFVRTVERTLHDSDSALAQQITTVSAALSAEIAAAVEVERLARVDAVEAEALAREALEAHVNDEVAAAITAESTARATAIGAVSSQVNTLTTRVDGNSSSIVDLSESVDGVRATRVLAITSNNKITGSIKMDGTGAVAVLEFLASAFRFYMPTVNGGVARPIIGVKNVDGVNVFALDGDLIANAIRANSVSVASLKAISSNFADMTCTGYQRSASGKMVIDWSNDRSWIDA